MNEKFRPVDPKDSDLEYRQGVWRSFEGVIGAGSLIPLSSATDVLGCWVFRDSNDELTYFRRCEEGSCLTFEPRRF